MPDSLMPRHRTRLELQGCNAVSRNLTDMAVRGRRDAGWRALQAGLSCLRELEEARASHDARSDIAGWLHNALSDLSGELARELDDAGLTENAAKIDLSELESIMARIDRPALALAAE